MNTVSTLAIIEKVKEWLFFLGLLCFSVGLPFSRTLTTIGGIVLAVHFFFDKDIFRKLIRAFTNILVWPFALFYLLHVLGLFYTEDISYAMTDLRVKLPILFLPVFLSQGPILPKTKRYSVLGIFVISMLLASLVAFFYSKQNHIVDPRHMIPFNNHIRFSLFICFAIAVSFGVLFKSKSRKWINIVLGVTILWLLYFLFINAAISGRLIGLACFGVFFLIGIYKQYRKIWFYGVLGLIFIFSFFVFLSAKKLTKDYLISKEVLSISELPASTINNNPYSHFPENRTLINGYRLGFNQCKTEISEEWENYSDINLDHHFPTGTSLYEVLVRYMTSVGLPKDSVGLSKLKKEDFLKIESGIENVIFEHPNDLKSRIYGILWGYQNYKLYGYSRGSSLMQRVELWKLGFKVFRDHPLIGAGTGDTVVELRKLQIDNNSSLEGLPLRTHNQILAVLAALGIPGLLAMLWMIFGPPSFIRLWDNLMYLAFQIIFILSLLTENTLETQFGVSFFAFFTCYFIFINPAPLKFN